MSLLDSNLLRLLPFVVVTEPDAGPSSARDSQNRRLKTGIELDVRHLLAATFASVLASGVVGSIIMYGNVKALQPTVTNVERQILECTSRTHRLEDSVNQRFVRLEDLIQQYLRESWRPERQEP